MKNIYISSCDKNGGIYRYNIQNGKLIFKEKTDIDRPMYTVFHNGKLWTLQREVDKETHFGGLLSFDVGDDGSLSNPSNVISTNGICPCHLTATDNDVYYVNYLSGNIASMNGKLDTHNGVGVNLPRQDMPHTHYVNVSPDNKYLLSCDLGLDSIFVYDFNLNVKSIAKVPEGDGARHLAYSSDGKYVYCVNELKSTVSVFSYNNGALELKNTYSCIENTTKNNTAAAIRTKGDYLFVSNRGEDTIVCFKMNADKLSFISRTSVSGSSPRDFDFCDNYLICTNETTNNITVFLNDNGTLIKTDEIKNIANPLCVTVIGENI